MESREFGQVGKYGTISLMKQLEPDTVVTAFGIDSDSVTFGRDLDCSVRLYYPDVSPVHCKIVFEEYKV
jgi:pSer/pThr/pTyr-binding forkhead associated (FHA) protein